MSILSEVCKDCLAYSNGRCCQNSNQDIDCLLMRDLCDDGDNDYHYEE